MSRKPARAYNHKGMVAGARRARDRAELYRHFIPEWPALWQSFEREAERLEQGKQCPTA